LKENSTADDSAVKYRIMFMLLLHAVHGHSAAGMFAYFSITDIAASSATHLLVVIASLFMSVQLNQPRQFQPTHRTNKLEIPSMRHPNMPIQTFMANVLQMAILALVQAMVS